MLPRLGELNGFKYYFQFTLNPYGKDIEAQPSLDRRADRDIPKTFRNDRKRKSSLALRPDSDQRNLRHTLPPRSFRPPRPQAEQPHRTLHARLHRPLPPYPSGPGPAGHPSAGTRRDRIDGRLVPMRGRGQPDPVRNMHSQDRSKPCGHSRRPVYRQRPDRADRRLPHHRHQRPEPAKNLPLYRKYRHRHVRQLPERMHVLLRYQRQGERGREQFPAAQSGLAHDDRRAVRGLRNQGSAGAQSPKAESTRCSDRIRRANGLSAYPTNTLPEPAGPRSKTATGLFDPKAVAARTDLVHRIPVTDALERTVSACPADIGRYRIGRPGSGHPNGRRAADRNLHRHFETAVRPAPFDRRLAVRSRLVVTGESQAIRRHRTEHDMPVTGTRGIGVHTRHPPVEPHERAAEHRMIAEILAVPLLPGRRGALLDPPAEARVVALVHRLVGQLVQAVVAERLEKELRAEYARVEMPPVRQDVLPGAKRSPGRADRPERRSGARKHCPRRPRRSLSVHRRTGRERLRPFARPIRRTARRPPYGPAPRPHGPSDRRIATDRTCAPSPSAEIRKPDTNRPDSSTGKASSST